MPRVRCCSRRTCFYAIAASIVLFWTTIACIATWVFFVVVLPARRSHYLESDYLHAFKYADFSDSIHQIFAKQPNGTTSFQPRVLPLIQDVPQLHYVSTDRTGPIDAVFGEWTPTFHDLLGLFFDGTGLINATDEEYWIYLGGTAKEGNSEVGPTVFQHRYKQSTCIDPAYICNMYNEAMDRVSFRWSVNRRRERAAGMTSEAMLRFADCDISPLLCTSELFGLLANPVMLIHLKIGTDCEQSTMRCPVTWSMIGLPIMKAPWTRQIRIPLVGGGSTVVPAFPDAEEQLWSLMAYAGAQEGLVYGSSYDAETDLRLTTTLEEDDGTDEAQFPVHSVNMGINNWGWFNYMWYNKYELDGWIFNSHFAKAHLQYWTDTFLQWWDGEPVVVRPYPPGAAIKARATRKRLNRAWDETQKKMDADRDRWMEMFEDDVVDSDEESVQDFGEEAKL